MFVQHVEALNANLKRLHTLLKTQMWPEHGTTFSRKTRVTAAVKSVLRLVGVLFMHARRMVWDFMRLKLGRCCEGRFIANSTRVFAMHVAGCVLGLCHLPVRGIVTLSFIIDVSHFRLRLSAGVGSN